MYSAVGNSARPFPQPVAELRSAVLAFVRCLRDGDCMFQVCTGAARRWRESSHGFSAGWSGVRNTVPNRMSSHAALHRTVVGAEAWGVAASRLNRFAPP